MTAPPSVRTGLPPTRLPWTRSSRPLVAEAPAPASPSLSTARRAARSGAVLRGHNLALALRYVAAHSGEVSRADISASTGLNRSTASSLVDELMSGGLVREVGATVRSGVGRRPTALALCPDGPAGLGLDINIDYVAACVVDLTGNVRYQYVLAQDQRENSAVDILARVARIARDALAAVRSSGLRPCGTAVAIPGLVNQTDGLLALAPNLGWRDVDVAAALRQVFGVTVRLDNEANFAATAEDQLIRGEQSYLYVNGQIGVGAGLVLNGELYRGRHGWSGEIGHQTIDRNGPPCDCGRRGCLEQYIGHEAILRAAGIRADAGTPYGARPTTGLIQDWAGRRDPGTLAALARAGSTLGIVLASCLNLLDVDRIVLGGIYRDLARWIVPEVEREVANRFIGAQWSRPIIQVASYGAEAPALGAARSVVRAVIDDPMPYLSGSGSYPENGELAAARNLIQK